ncbi:hypothetical protein DFJ73DRAFT_824128 [Zopfochytrium polystomum]|nr:hypothetical protein DFJ73DRAFT_824128 [Zopfochytrium polystomum]
MPIVVKELEFSETDALAFVTVSLNGVTPGKADVYCNDAYVKVNFPPFLFEADLFALVDPDASTAVVGDGAVKLTLAKVETGLWNQLRPSDMTKEDLRKRRQEAQDRAQERAKSAQEEKAKRKQEEHYKLVKQQIEVERAARLEIENLKKQEAERFESSISEWKNSLSSTQQVPGQHQADPVTQDVEEEDILLDSTVGRIDTVVRSSANQQRVDSKIFEDDHDSEASEAEFTEEEMAMLKQKVERQMKAKFKSQIRPPPRQSANIVVTFTDRGALPTPVARESEDAKWKVRINEAYVKDAQTRSALVEEPLDLNEKNPIFLKDKGNAFLKRGDFQGAINAYTAALDLDDSQYTCFSNRAICHLKLGNFKACHEDCSASIELVAAGRTATNNLTPDEKQHLAKMYARRGAVSGMQQEWKSAEDDYLQALALDPSNEALKRDLEEIRNAKRP